MSLFATFKGDDDNDLKMFLIKSQIKSLVTKVFYKKYRLVVTNMLMSTYPSNFVAGDELNKLSRLGPSIGLSLSKFCLPIIWLSSLFCPRPILIVWTTRVVFVF